MSWVKLLPGFPQPQPIDGMPRERVVGNWSIGAFYRELYSSEGRVRVSEKSPLVRTSLFQDDYHGLSSVFFAVCEVLVSIALVAALLGSVR